MIQSLVFSVYIQGFSLHPSLGPQPVAVSAREERCNYALSATISSVRPSIGRSIGTARPSSKVRACGPRGQITRLRSTRPGLTRPLLLLGRLSAFS
jgi:hypothetical protein